MNLADFIKKYGNVSVDEEELKELLGVTDEKYFYPKKDEGYYLVDIRGEVDKRVNRSLTEGRKHFENNELFKTEEEAKEHAEKQRFLLKMKRDFAENSDEIDWGEDSNQGKYYLVYHSGLDGYIDIGLCYTTKTTDLVTTNRDWLEEYIAKHEEEIKKYYFEIEED